MDLMPIGFLWIFLGSIMGGKFYGLEGGGTELYHEPVHKL